MKEKISASMDNIEFWPTIGCAIVDITPEFMADVQRLSAIVQAEGVTQIRRTDYGPDLYEYSDDPEDDDALGEEVRVDYMALCVDDTQFWWEGWPKHESTSFSTDRLNIKSYAGVSA